MSDQRETKRILVVANETCAGAAVTDEVRYRAGVGPAEVLVVSPALSGSRMTHWLTSDRDEARRNAEDRLATSLAALRAAGLSAEGRLGDADPMLALDDAYRTFEPHEIVISTHPPARSNWLEKRVVAKARDRYPIPVTHVVVDLVHEAALTHDDPRPAPRMAERTLTLYRHVGYDEALAVAREGFTNQRDVVPGRSGVLFTDSAGHPGGPDEPTLFVVEVPESAAVAYRLDAEADGVTRYALPAEFVNRHHPRALVSEWSE